MMAVVSAALLAAQITSASASRGRAELAVHIEADGPIDAGKVSARVESRRLLLSLPATLDASSRTFHAAHRYLQARRTSDGVELEVPIGSKVSCSGPVTVAKVEGGLEARVSCKEEAPPEVAMQPVIVAQPQAAPQIAAARAETHEAPAAKPVEIRVEVSAAKPPEIPVADARAAKLPELPAAEARAARPAEPAAAFFEAAPPQPQVDPLAGKEKSSPIGPAAGALAVVALGGAAYFLRNRKKQKSTHIEVLETAALGPKRALVLARVGGKTLLLASSEAGISLLENLGDLTMPLEHAAETEPLPPHAILDKLRKFSQRPLPSASADPFSRLSKYLKPAPAPQFDALFAEEQEDQELRMKLLAGQPARVQ
jgi:LPXTG-motif cell wall-anchored protein